MSLLIEFPLLAVALGVVFLLLYWRWRRRTSTIAGGAWLLYAAYETAMRHRWLCTGECNIRIDLLLIYPVLLAISGIAGVILVRWVGQTRLRQPGSG